MPSPSRRKSRAQKFGEDKWLGEVDEGKMNPTVRHGLAENRCFPPAKIDTRTGAGSSELFCAKFPESPGGPGNAGPNGNVPTPPSGREAVAGCAPNGPEKVRQTIREFAREPPIRKNNVKRNT